MLELSEKWKAAYPGAAIGILAMEGIVNLASHPTLEERKRRWEEEIRSAYAGKDRKFLLADSVLRLYAGYYKGFNKTYHVLLQIESIAWKGKSIPSVAIAVEAMFLAEMKNRLLTAGHDLDSIRLPLRVDVSSGVEKYGLMRGEVQTLKEGDMFIQDGEGILSSILYGPDQRSQIRPETNRVVYTVYAPAGIESTAIDAHLLDLESLLRVAAPKASTIERKVYFATRVNDIQNT